MNLLEVRSLSCGYGDRPVLHEVSFALAEGQCLVVLGPNGSGKSTLMKALAGLLPAQGGITVCGAALAALPRAALARRLAYMSQFSAAPLPYTVGETVLLGRYARQKPGLFSAAGEADRAAVRAAIGAAGLAGLEDRAVTELSGGQLQRVFLAQALAQEPQVILLDEPTSHLDLHYQAELAQFLRGWAKQGQRAVVAVAHDLNLAAVLADEMLFLKDGRVAACGRPDAVLSRELLAEVYGMDVASYLAGALGRWKELLQ